MTNKHSYISRAAEALGVTVADVRAKCRQPHISRRRYAIAHVMKDRLGLSYRSIAALIGVTHGNAAQHAVKRSKELVEICPDHAAMVDALEMVV